MKKATTRKNEKASQSLVLYEKERVVWI